MSLYLQPDVAVRIDRGVPTLWREHSGVSRPINASEALALTFLGATGDAAAASALLSACVPARDGDVWVRRVIDRFWCYLGGGAPRPPDLSWLEQLDASRTLAALRARREPAPSAVIWVVTLGCNRRCPYCFYEVFGHAAGLSASPPDATFPLGDAIRMVREMSRIGASDLYLTGGEPLLRRDLPEIIAAAATHRVRTRVTTKYPVDAPLAKQLANDEMRLTDPAGLDDEIARLQAAFPGIRIEKFEELGSGARAGVQCDIGITKLFFLPDGLVHRCYKLTRDATLCGKDLKHVSVAEAWHDPGFAPVISPPREAYAGSSCHACGRFDSCHADGRCIYTARQDHGRYHAPDRSCGGPFPDPGAPVPVRLLARSG